MDTEACCDYLVVSTDFFLVFMMLCSNIFHLENLCCCIMAYIQRTRTFFSSFTASSSVATIGSRSTIKLQILKNVSKKSSLSLKVLVFEMAEQTP